MKLIGVGVLIFSLLNPVSAASGEDRTEDSQIFKPGEDHMVPKMSGGSASISNNSTAPNQNNLVARVPPRTPTFRPQHRSNRPSQFEKPRYLQPQAGRAPNIERLHDSLGTQSEMLQELPAGQYRVVSPNTMLADRLADHINTIPEYNDFGGLSIPRINLEEMEESLRFGDNPVMSTDTRLNHTTNGQGGNFEKKALRKKLPTPMIIDGDPKENQK